MPKPRTAEVVIYTGDYLDRIRHIERKHDAAMEAYERAVKAEEKEIRRVGSTPESAALRAEADRLAEDHDRLVEEAEDAAIRVRVTTVRRRKYRELADAHPPREGEKGDAALGVNALTFREALVPEALVEVTEDGQTKAWKDYTADEREDFLDTLAEADFERVFGMAYALVNGYSRDLQMLRGDHSSPTTPESAAS